MKRPMNDLLVVLPGILGSSLYRREDAVWDPTGSAWRAIQTVFRDFDRFALRSGIGDEDADDDLEARSVIPNLHSLPGFFTGNAGYDVLLARLRSKLILDESNFLAFAYDWRLSNRNSARRLKRVVEPRLERLREKNPEAKIVFICHSMGGLVARWYVQREGGAELTRRLVTIGTPHRGSIKALQQLVNGGPFLSVGRDATKLARSLPSLHQLLPTYGCIETAEGLKHVDEVEIPELDSQMVGDALSFHRDMDTSAPACEVVPFVGFRQPTPTTGRFRRGRVEIDNTIEGRNEGGDGTVARGAATPFWMAPNSAVVRGVAGQHASLTSADWILDDLELALTAPLTPYKGHGADLAMEVDDFALASEPLRISAWVVDDPTRLLRLTITNERGTTVHEDTMAFREGRMRAAVGSLAPGVYLVNVGSPSRSGQLNPVSTPVVIGETA